jgi:amino acid adenylation domain-containing protein
MSLSILKQCINEIVRRHEALRTVFRSEDGMPVQLVLPEMEIPVQLVNFSDLRPEQHESRLAKLAVEDARRRFHLERGPLLRVTLVRLCETEYVLLMTMHHIIADGWSLNVLSRELGVLYDAFATGRPSPLRPQVVQYADYAVWLRESFAGKRMAEDLAWWRSRLAGAEPLRLWTDRPRPSVASFAGASYKTDFGTELGKALSTLGRQERSTLFMTLLAGFTALLSRYTGQDDIVIGTPVASRNFPELESVIGLFVNTLVLRTDVSGAPTFRELLCRVRETALDAWAHQDLPFEKLVEELHTERDLSRNPIFQVTLQLYPPVQSGMRPQASDPIMGGDRGTTPFELAVNFQHNGERLEAVVEYHTDLFDAATIGRMMQHYRRILEAGVRDPDCAVTQLEMIDAAERERVARTWNDTRHEFPSQATADELFEQQARRTPEAAAIRSNGRTVTYSQLNETSSGLAEQMRSFLAPGGIAGVLLPRGFEMISAMFGIWKAGGAWIPLDSATPASRVAAILCEARANVLITERDHLQRLGESLPKGIRLVTIESLRCQLTAGQADEKVPRASVDSPAYVIFTSGTTGEPKGILVSHRSLVNYLHWAVSTYPVRQGRGSPLHTSIAFDLSFTSVFVPLLAGGCVHVLPETSDAESLAELLQTEGDFGLIKLTPAHLNILAQQTTPRQVAGRTRCFVIGGENLLAEDTLLWQRYAPETELINEYGPAETVVGCSFHRLGRDQDLTGSVPIGRPIWNMRAYVLDRHGNPQPAGVPGELYIAGAGVSAGYINRPDLTAAVFLPDPFVVGERMYRTGDLARWRDDGVLEYLGRLDRQIKVRGYRVELQEVEEVLARCAGVRQVAVVARGGSRPSSLIAFVVPIASAEDSSGLADSVLEYARRELPVYMAPSSVRVLGALPLAASGKIDRDALLRLQDDSVPVNREYVAPRNEVEAAVAQIWATVLENGRVGVNDDFFASLGGHSLLATQAMARVRSLFRVDLPLRLMFEHPTVAGFCEAIMARDGNRERIERVASLMRFIEGLSDDQVKVLLEQHKRPALKAFKTTSSRMEET